MLPPNSDDLTLLTDPVTRWALHCFGAFGALTVGCALAFAVKLIPW